MSYLLYFLIFLTGLCIGSFLNVVIFRGPAWWGLAPSAHTDQSIPRGQRSQCASCGKQLKAWHLVPILSWLILRGKCAFCGATISVRYPLVELAGGLSALAAVLAFGLTLEALAAFVFCCILIAAAMIDWRTGYLPDALTLPLLALGLVINVFSLFSPFTAALIGALAGYGVFWLVRFAYLRLRGIEGLGLGDAKLLAALGAWLGWTALPFIVLMAALAGLAAVGALALSGQKVDGQTPVRFGPFLGVAGIICLFAYPAMLDLLYGPGTSVMMIMEPA